MRNALESLLGRRRGCDAVEEHLDECLTGNLPDDARARIAAHLTGCPGCQEKVRAYSRLGAALVALDTVPVPDRPGDWQAVRNRLVLAPPTVPETDIRPARPFWSGRVIAAGVAAVALGVTAATAPTLYPEKKPSSFGSGEDAVNAAPKSPPPTIMDGAQRKPIALGKMTVGALPNTLSVAPVFVGVLPDTIEPLVVEIGNGGEATDAEITLQSDEGASRDRVYRQKVRLAAHGASRFFLYPGTRGVGNSNTSYPPSWVVTLDAPGRRQKVATFSMTGFSSRSEAMAYIGNEFNAVTPRNDPRNKPGAPVRSRRVFPNYVTPENAPDRAIGYRGFRLVVLSADARELNAAQWRAIREWVLSGGRLLLIGDALLDTPGITDLAPVRRAAGGALAPMAGAATHGIKVLPGSNRLERYATMTAVRYGQGTVIQLPFDPATDAFRRWDGGYSADAFWTTLVQWHGVDAAPGERVQWDDRAYLAYLESGQFGAPENARAKDDPFRLTFPTMQQVTFIFLGYFVLVVPVSFVVLKHARRLNWTWVTGPVVAGVVAGGIFLFTARLYFAPMARRTTGSVYLQSGERFGRFNGQSEFFFPRAGTYQLPFHGVDFVQSLPGTGQPDYDDRSENMGFPLETSSDADTTTAQLSTGNLTFRRIYHEQTVTFPGAVTVTVRPDGDGNLVGHIDNASGQTLHAVLLEKESFSPAKNKRLYDSVERYPQVYPLGDLPLGRTLVRITATDWMTVVQWYNQAAGGGDRAVYGYLEQLRGTLRSTNLFYAKEGRTTMTLLAQAPGAGFGPAKGQDFSDARSVTVVIGVETDEEGGKR